MFQKKTFFIIFILFGLFFLNSKNSFAQVVINEFSPNSEPGGYGDWIELYIYENIDLSTYYLTHVKTDGSSEGKIDISPPYIYGPGSANGNFKIISVSNYLGNSGDRIRLYVNGNSVPIDDISYGDFEGVCLPQSTGGIGRIYQNGIEGTNWIERFSNTSKGVSNSSNIIEPCPTPTQVPTISPTNSPTPTNAPTNTSTPSNTNTPTPKPSATKSPTPTKKISITPLASNMITKNVSPIVENGDVLSIETNRDFLTITPSLEENPDKSTNNFPIIAVLFVALGLGFIIFAGVMLVKTKRQTLKN